MASYLPTYLPVFVDVVNLIFLQNGLRYLHILDQTAPFLEPVGFHGDNKRADNNYSI